MILKQLYLRNFRNYAESSFSFSPKMNIIFGGNAQGKTNLLEAIYLLSTGRSFRTPQLKDLIHEGSSFFYLEALIEKEGFSQTIKLYYNGTDKKLEVNSSSYASFLQLLGIMPSVLHTPQDILLVVGSPVLRRRFLNLLISQQDPLYVHHLFRFVKALKQRNTLLKQKKEKSIDIWEKEMAKSAGYIMMKRKQLVLHLLKPLQELSSSFLKQEQLHIAYQSCAGNDVNNSENENLELSKTISSYQKLLEKSRKKELFLGTTIVGPHRDDLLFTLNEKPLKTFASEGQKKTFLSLLRLAEWSSFSEFFQDSVIVSFDDWNAHLDEMRRFVMKDLLKKFGQTFLAMPECDQEGFPEGKSFLIEDGKIN